MPDTPIAVPTSITLDSIYKAMQDWRKNKKVGSPNGIPDKIWKMVFELESNGYQGAQLRKMFGFNSIQYTKKQGLLNKGNGQPSEVPEDPSATKIPATTLTSNLRTTPQFSEMVVARKTSSPIPSLTRDSQATKNAIKTLKSPDNQVAKYLSHETIIVECVRPDGSLLKIHTTDQSLSLVMQAFYAQESIND